MVKRKQGPINKKVDFLSNKLNKYSIRKFTVGTASILVGATLIFGANHEAQAAENTADSTNENIDSKSSNKPDSIETSTTEQPSTQQDSKTDESTTQSTAEQPKEKSSSTTSSKDNTAQDTTSNKFDSSEASPSDATTQSNNSTGTSSTKDALSITSDSSVANKQAYTSDMVDNLNAGTRNNTDAIVDAVSNDMNLETALTDSTPTTFALNSTDTTSSTGGSLVNDKIHVTNASLTLNQKNNKHDNNTVWPTSNEQLKLSADYALDNSIKEGDTFTIKYGDYIRPGALELPAKNTQLRSKEGSIVANGVYDETTNTTTYTFTNYVNQYQNITGSFNLLATPKRETVTKDKQNYPMDVTIANQKVRENFVVDYGNHKDHYTSAAVANVDNVNNKHNEVVYLNQSGKRIYDAKYFSTVQNGTFIPNEVKVYEVLDDNVLVDSFNPNLNGPAVKEVTSKFTPRYSLNNTRVDIDLNSSNMKKGARYIITQAVKPSGTGNVITDYELTRYGNQASRYPTGTKSTIVSYINGSSTAQGDNPTYNLGDYVWEDTNKNGVQDKDEKGIPGVYVILKDNNNKELQRTTTDDTGRYLFNNLQNGTYNVEFVIPNNYTPSPSNTIDNDKIDSDGQKDGDDNVVVAKGIIDNADNMTVDTGFYKTPKYNLGNYVWEDTNKDGKQDSTEKGISGVTVTLKNENGKVLQTTKTDKDGKYQFTGLENGTYKVEFEAPSGYTPTQVGSGNDESVDSNGTSTTGVIKDKDNDTIDSGFYKPTYNLGDYVWEDTNKDGKQDSTEKGISGVTVTLKNENGEVLQTTKTDKDGKYQFTDLNNGTYKVEFETPSGYTPTSVTSGNDTEKDSNGLTTTGVIKDADNMTLDSGFYKTPKYSLGDYVWYDSNKDGKQDSTEKGIKDVKVTLLNEKGEVIGTTKTDENGKYRFDNLDSGKYKVIFEKPAGLTQTDTNTTEDDKDADGGEVDVTITDHDDFTLDNGYFEEDASDSDSDSDSDS
ncbi:TPA: carboxypeptidase regulatory-like domain-containing protein, partial [Staphylococcus aureus]|nr:carboxypeptidase regulatory-like domain-containing protein [Staphylococcus aureus]